ncbi:MAG: DUF1800 family protein [Gemmataceae bacterium]
MAIDPKWAWEPYRPGKDSPWDLKKAGHLYRRAAFGGTKAELDAAVKMGHDKVIDLLLAGSPDAQGFESFSMSLMERAGTGQEARDRWLYRMIHTPHPLREKITLFWHNHFATSNGKVNNGAYMVGQYRLLHRNALGNFGTMLQEITFDPAMLVWLDTNISQKNMPNENYARELMELFSLGIGHYSETDIREAARAFTGWRIENGKAVFKPDQHDEGEKKVLGKTGNFKAEDIVRICLEQKSMPYFITGKLYRYLISETEEATPELLAPLAEPFRKDQDIGALVARMIRSNLFFAPQVYRTRVKSPVDFTLGIVRALEGKPQTSPLAQSLEALGQNLFFPPSVKGWDGGPAWLNGQTLLFRNNLALALTSTTDNRFGNRCDPVAIAEKYGAKSDAQLVHLFVTLFLQGDVPQETKDSLKSYLERARTQKVPVYWSEKEAAEHRVRALCHLVLTQPEFQLD